MRSRTFALVHAIAIPMMMTTGSCIGYGQERPIDSDGANLRYQSHLDELTTRLDRVRLQLEQSLSEIENLRTEVRNLRGALEEKNHSFEAEEAVRSLRNGLAQVREDTDVLQAEIKQHEQTKVESVSKYPVRIGGTILLTSVFNSGNSDNFGLPIIALPRQPQSASGSLNATVNQSVFDLAAQGPHLWGARTWGDLSIDFWGTSSNNSYYSPWAGTARLRTAHAKIEWRNQSLGFALDRSLFAPEQPTSWLSVAQPAFAWSGNLWSWLPQVQYERSLLAEHALDLQFGLMDVAAPAIYRSNSEPSPNSSERSKQPGYEARVGTRKTILGRAAILGASGYYSRKSFANGRHLDAWAVASDWDLPITQALGIAGQFYRGRAIGGLGGGAFKDYVTAYGSPSGLNAAGGWAQLKWTASSTMQGNLAFGMDDAFARDLNDADTSNVQSSDYSNLARNQTSLGNFIYRPRSYLLLSAEMRRIVSRTSTGQVSVDRVLGISTGFTF